MPPADDARAPRDQDLPAGRPGTLELWLLLLVYVLPVLAICAFLVAVDLAVLAVGLLAAEAVVGGLVLLARRRPARPPGDPARHPLLVPAAMAGLLLAMVGVAVLAAQAG